MLVQPACLRGPLWLHRTRGGQRQTAHAGPPAVQLPRPMRRAGVAWACALRGPAAAEYKRGACPAGRGYGAGRRRSQKARTHNRRAPRGPNFSGSLRLTSSWRTWAAVKELQRCAEAARATRAGLRCLWRRRGGTRGARASTSSASRDQAGGCSGRTAGTQLRGGPVGSLQAPASCARGRPLTSSQRQGHRGHCAAGRGL